MWAAAQTILGGLPGTTAELATARDLASLPMRLGGVGLPVAARGRPLAARGAYRMIRRDATWPTIAQDLGLRGKLAFLRTLRSHTHQKLFFS